MMMGFDWGGMWFGWLLIIGFTGAVILLIIWLFSLSLPAKPEQPAQSALDILQARYARGEISKEEYLDTRATLIQP